VEAPPRALGLGLFPRHRTTGNLLPPRAIPTPADAMAPTAIGLPLSCRMCSRFSRTRNTTERTIVRWTGTRQTRAIAVRGGRSASRGGELAH
jgi:hypothetical protein